MTSNWSIALAGRPLVLRSTCACAGAGVLPASERPRVVQCARVLTPAAAQTPAVPLPADVRRRFRAPGQEAAGADTEARPL